MLGKENKLRCDFNITKTSSRNHTSYAVDEDTDELIEYSGKFVCSLKNLDYFHEYENPNEFNVAHSLATKVS